MTNSNKMIFSTPTQALIAAAHIARQDMLDAWNDAERERKDAIRQAAYTAAVEAQVREMFGAGYVRVAA